MIKRIALTLGLTILSMDAFAEMGVLFVGGSGVGTLTGTPGVQDLIVTVYPISGGIEYHTGETMSSRYTLGIVGHSDQVEYSLGDVTFTGSYNTAAISASWITQLTENFQLQAYTEIGRAHV